MKVQGVFLHSGPVFHAEIPFLTPGFVSGSTFPVIELGEAGSSLYPPAADDTTGNHPNQFLLVFKGKHPYCRDLYN